MKYMYASIQLERNKDVSEWLCKKLERRFSTNDVQLELCVSEIRETALHAIQGYMIFTSITCLCLFFVATLGNGMSLATSAVRRLGHLYVENGD